MTYTPDVLTIEEGDIVSWVSLGGTHDVNFDINFKQGNHLVIQTKLHLHHFLFKDLVKWDL